MKYVVIAKPKLDFDTVLSYISKKNPRYLEPKMELIRAIFDAVSPNWENVVKDYNKRTSRNVPLKDFIVATLGIVASKSDGFTSVYNHNKTLQEYLVPYADEVEQWKKLEYQIVDDYDSEDVDD